MEKTAAPAADKFFHSCRKKLDKFPVPCYYDLNNLVFGYGYVMIKKIAFLILMFFGISTSIYAQSDELNPVRIGIKAGSPIIIGLGAEFVIPLDTVCLGINAEGSYFPVNRDYFSFIPERYSDTELNVFYGAGGLRLYFNEEADGFNIGAYAGRYQLEVVQDYSYMGQTASGEISIGMNLFMAKLGYRWIWDNFFIGLDAGYGAGKFDKNLKVTVNYPTTGKRTEYIDVEDILPLAHGVVASLEMGIAF